MSTLTTVADNVEKGLERLLAARLALVAATQELSAIADADYEISASTAINIQDRSRYLRSELGAPTEDDIKYHSVGDAFRFDELTDIEREARELVRLVRVFGATSAELTAA